MTGRSPEKNRAHRISARQTAILFALAAAALVVWSLHDEQSTSQLPPKTPSSSSSEGAATAPPTSDSATTDLTSLAEGLFLAGKLRQAEQQLRKAVASTHSSEPRLLLGNFLYACGRIHEARETWLPLLKQGGIDLLSIPMFGSDSLTFGIYEQAISNSRQLPLDATSACALAHQLFRSDRPERALELLNDLPSETLAESRQFCELRAQLLLALGHHEQLQQWLAELDDTTRHTPALLAVQGLLCRQLRNPQEAAWCFLAGLEQAPGDYVACSQLSELLSQFGHKQESNWARARAALIKKYEKACTKIHNSRDVPSADALQPIAQLCLDLGAVHESYAWSQIAAVIEPNNGWSSAFQHQLPSHHASSQYIEIPQVVQIANIVEHLPPNWMTPSVSSSQKSDEGTGNMRFEDMAAIAGLKFSYKNGRGHANHRRFFEFTGGGVAAFDFDGDAWPDLFFTQGGATSPTGLPEATGLADPIFPPDAIFRNIRGNAVTNATEASGLNSRSYSQGCTSGDFNNDGFADLYVANIGSNELWRNNGDGTFTSLRIDAPKTWTTSCAMADINGDGAPDIYDVNHVELQGVHEQMCFEGDTTFPCDLSKMEPAQDTFLAGDGYGQFSDTTTESGFRTDEGIGLGIVVGDLSKTGHLDVFIANDARPNFLFVQDSQTKRFRNVAAERGVARNTEGKAQACMGVAAGDADGDQLTDLFITNFYEDYNILYQQSAAGFFFDGSTGAQLAAPSFPFLGFGTQFLDADLDGDLDIVVTNGDVDDLSSFNPDRRWKQRGQLFRNTGGAFHEVLPQEIGDCFARKSLGRGLAILDWNRDQKPDVTWSNIGSDAPLLINRSKAIHEGVTLKLVGTKSARHPVGATVQCNWDKAQFRALSAGCGYQAFNQPILFFAKKQANETLASVNWPSTLTGDLTIPPQGDWVIVENYGVFAVPR